MTVSDSSVAYLGTTPPVSLAFPSHAESLHNAEMELVMKSGGDIYESAEGQHGREKVIKKLKAILLDWACCIGRAKNIPEAVCTSGGGILLKIFGSTRLGVHTPDADIDSLCIAPSFIERGDFFTNFCTMLKSRTDIGMLSAVPEAYTPVLKFVIDNVAIDMIFVSLGTQSIPSDLDILNTKCLKGIDEQGVRSLNGCRVAEWICRLVPNFLNFCTTLRFIKHWARQRALYSNVLGFLGGVNYAILTAFVCQRYPNACPVTLVRKFFLMYTQWRWPNPIMLTGIEELPPAETDGRYLPVWNPKIYPKDGTHLMPIITPAYPAMNSSYNVGLPQFRLLQEEIQRGQMILQDNKLFSTPFPWSLLAASAVGDFFLCAPRYIQVDISASNVDDHRSWFGWCESRLRPLILSLEQPPMIFCHPQAKFFHRKVICRTSPNASSDSMQYAHDCTDSESVYMMKETTSAAAVRVMDESNLHNSSFEAVPQSGESGCHFRTPSKTFYVSSIFIGLSFCNQNMKSADVTPSILDFIYRVNIYEGKRASMGINVTPLTPQEIPHFAREAPPSSSCTTSQQGATEAEEPEGCADVGSRSEGDTNYYSDVSSGASLAATDIYESNREVEQTADVYHQSVASSTNHLKQEGLQNHPTVNEKSTQQYWFAEVPEIATSRLIFSRPGDVKNDSTSSSSCIHTEALSHLANPQGRQLFASGSCDVGVSQQSSVVEYPIDSNAKRKQYLEQTSSDQESSVKEGEARKSQDADRIPRQPLTSLPHWTETTSGTDNAIGYPLLSENLKQADAVTRSPQKRTRKEIHSCGHHP